MNKSAVYRSKGSSLLAAVLLTFASLAILNINLSDWQHLDNVPLDAAEIIDKCNALKALPVPPRDFHQRLHSDRFVHGTPPTLFKNASIWTGRASGNEIVVGDLLIDQGLIKAIGSIKDTTLTEYKDLVVIDAEGAWITPGYVVPSLILFSPLMKPLLASLTFTLIWVSTVLPALKGLLIQIHLRAWCCPGFGVLMASTLMTMHISCLSREV